MKNFKFFPLIALFALGGLMFNSCEDEFRNTAPAEIISQDMSFKAMSTLDLPIYMDQEILIGHAEISYDGDNIVVDIILDELEEGWVMTEAHLYAGEDEPEKSSPGLFPYDWYLDVDGEFMGFDVPFDGDICEDVIWHYALHLALEFDTGEEDELSEPIILYETAWVLPEGGMEWNKGNGKGKDSQQGWGVYFEYILNYTPVLENIDLLMTPAGLEEWTELADLLGIFQFCTNGNGESHFFLNADLEFNLPIEDGMYGFNLVYVEQAENPAFWTWWAGKGVNELAVDGTWQYAMWQIINGQLPIFYLVVEGGEYFLMDGLQYATGHMLPLVISGDYPAGLYSYTGTVAGEYCDTELTITLNVGPCD